MAVNGPAVGITLAGVILTAAGIKGLSVTAVIQDVVTGKNPKTAIANQFTSGNTGTPVAASDVGITPAGTTFGQSSLAQLWVNNGGPQSTAAFAARVAMAESSGRSDATSSNPDGGTNVGLWQLDTKGVGSGYTIDQLKNPDLNARITIAATNGGQDWKEWSDPVVNNG